MTGPPGTVRRPSLVDRLTRDHSRPIVSVVAPPGYGKTTLLSEWADSRSQAVERSRELGLLEG
jgi:LuxR family transcriptional regulator, maltose regulon positive regulatory protein